MRTVHSMATLSNTNTNRVKIISYRVLFHNAVKILTIVNKFKNQKYLA